MTAKQVAAACPQCGSERAKKIGGTSIADYGKGVFIWDDHLVCECCSHDWWTDLQTLRTKDGDA